MQLMVTRQNHSLTQKLVNVTLTALLGLSLATADVAEAKRRRSSRSKSRSSSIQDIYVGAGLGPIIGFSTGYGGAFGLAANGGVRMKDFGIGGHLVFSPGSFSRLLWLGGDFVYHMDKLFPIPGFFAGAKLGTMINFFSIPTFSGFGTTASVAPRAFFVIGPQAGFDYKFKNFPISVGGETSLVFAIGQRFGVFLNILAMAKYHFN